MRPLAGLNWGHRRALAPMEAASRLAKAQLGIDVEWTVQDLAGFEHGLTAAAADRFDLVVFDHPFSGSVAAGQWMLPLDATRLAITDADFIGGSLASYRYAGELWALPVDGATQCAVYRPDLVESAALPHRWAEVAALGVRLRARGLALGIATRSPHGALALLALCANLGAPLAADPWADPFDRHVLREAAGLLRALVTLADPRGREMNAIDLHEAMAHGDAVAYCPIAYAYTTYAEAGDGSRLAFAPFPGPDGSPAGSVLGGTGLGITRSCRDVQGATSFVALVATAQVQRDTFMRHHGQPARVEGWQGTPQDAAFDHTHAGLEAAMRVAWTRPRFPGYIGWQSDAGMLVERYVAGDSTSDSLIASLEAAWRRRAPPLPE